MKKRLEAELISIAHRVLKLKNKSEIDQLFIETQKLYNVLGVLKFYNDNIDVSKATISENDLEKILQKEPEEEIIVEEEIIISTETTIPEIEEEFEVEEELSENEEEEIIENKEDTNEVDEKSAEIGFDFEPSEDFSLEAEKDFKEVVSNEKQQFSFEDLLGNDYVEPVFVKPNETSISNLESKSEEISNTINDKIGLGINIGLNDRIGFVNNLFGGSNEDYNRVVSQLNTFDTYNEAVAFIEDFVKPDYNNWEGVEDYVERFLEIIENKFE